MASIKAKKGIKYVAFWTCTCGFKNTSDIDSEAVICERKCQVCGSFYDIDIQEPEPIIGDRNAAIFGRCERCGIRGPYSGDTCHAADPDLVGLLVDQHHIAKCGGNVQLLPVMD